MVDSIYSIVTDPGGLPAVLDGMADLIGGKGLLMGPLSRATQGDASLVTYASGVFHDCIPDYLGHFVALNPRKNWLTTHDFTELVFSDHDFIDDRAIKKNAFYNDFLLKNGNLHSLDRLSTRDGGSKLWISVQYSSVAESPGDAHREVFSLLSSHLLQALDLYGRLRAIGPGERDLLEHYDCPALILSASGRILAVNQAADRLQDRRISLANRRLGTPNPRDAARLERLFGAALARGGGKVAPDVAAIVGDGAQAPLLVRAAPLRVCDQSTLLDLVVADAPALLVLLHDHRAPSRSAVAALRVLGLTAAEARVADLIAGGRSPEEAAADLDISLSTVRHHVKRVHEKLGIRRQADLVRLTNGLGRFSGS